LNGAEDVAELSFQKIGISLPLFSGQPFNRSVYSMECFEVSVLIRANKILKFALVLAILNWIYVPASCSALEYSDTSTSMASNGRSVGSCSSGESPTEEKLPVESPTNVDVNETTAKVQANAISDWQDSGQRDSDQPKPVELVVLGIAQDAGFPQAGCGKACCQLAWANPSLRRHVASIGIIDHESNQRWLIDCTPDFPDQLRMLGERSPVRKLIGKKLVPGDEKATEELDPKPIPQLGLKLDGIFLTHAHIGHYSGLINLGREVMGANQVPTYAMPRMSGFLKTNGPWSQLVKLENIKLRPLVAEVPVKLNARVTVTPFQVPHRDEFSETVGFMIAGPRKTVVFLPDIDKWSRWDRSIEKLIAASDFAYLDGTFFENGEIPGRDMALIPHPFVSESINRFAPLDETERKKVRFIHFNHTNPVLQPNSKSARDIERAGMSIAKQGEVIEL